MAWVKLDDSFWSNPKVVAVGNEAAGAYVRMLSYCGMHLTDGAIPESVARFIAKPVTLGKLEEFSFLVHQGAAFLIPDYLEFNPSGEQVEEKRRVRAEAGKQGGFAKAKGLANAKAKARANA